MPHDKLGRTLGLGVLAVALLFTVSAASMPIRDSRAGMAQIALWGFLLVAHAALYWCGASVRSRLSTGAYIALQTAVVFAFGMSGAMMPVVVALYVASIAETIRLTDGRWNSVSVTLIAIVLFTVTAAVSWDLYQASTMALLLALAGVIAHALSALWRPAPLAVVAAAPAPSSNGSNGSNGSTNGHSSLTDREAEVLRALVTGARSAHIATSLGITERTVKAHLASIYQKLGVDSRAAAVAAAVQRGLV